MAKKKDEKDVLIVRDEKTGEISVVAGLNADGSPKRIPAKVENSQAFLQFDKHGDMLDNFFKNFFRQCKEPTRFGFYRIAAEQVDQLKNRSRPKWTRRPPNNPACSRSFTAISGRLPFPGAAFFSPETEAQKNLSRKLFPCAS